MIYTLSGLFTEAARPCRHATGDRWFVEETYVKVAGRWRYLYRAVDQYGQVIDVLLSDQRDTAAARQFFTRAVTHEVWVGSDAATAGPATVATDAVELLTGRAIHRVRECDAPDCALLFLDTSRPGRRRWCADGACRSKARGAAYRARHKHPAQ